MNKNDSQTCRYLHIYIYFVKVFKLEIAALVMITFLLKFFGVDQSLIFNCFYLISFAYFKF